MLVRLLDTSRHKGIAPLSTQDSPKLQVHLGIDNGLSLLTFATETFPIPNGAAVFLAMRFVLRRTPLLPTMTVPALYGVC